MSHVAAAVKTVPELFARHRGPGAGAVRPPPRPAAADFLTPLTAGTVDGLRRFVVFIGSQVIFAPTFVAFWCLLVTSLTGSQHLWPSGRASDSLCADQSSSPPGASFA